MQFYSKIIPSCPRKKKNEKKVKSLPKISYEHTSLLEARRLSLQAGFLEAGRLLLQACILQAGLLEARRLLQQQRLPALVKLSAGMHSLTQHTTSSGRIPGRPNFAQALRTNCAWTPQPTMTAKTPNEIQMKKNVSVDWRKPDGALPDTTNFMLYWRYVLCDYLHKRTKHKKLKR